MTHPSSPDRLTQIDAYLDGSLDPADLADFTVWLMSDPSAPDLLTEKSLVHSWLIDHHHHQAAAIPTPPTPTLRRSRSVWYIAAAALIALALTAWFILFSAPQSESPNPSSTTVALLTNTDGAVFGESTVPTALGSALTPGKLTLTAGSAQIMFQRGAVVDLHAPATLHLINQNTARLQRGELYATVPPAAAGFTVHGAEGLKVIDLGTEFSMHVVAGRGSDVRVFAGHASSRRVTGCASHSPPGRARTTAVARSRPPRSSSRKTR
ncbi:hypothetical protein HED60_00005 [Planctomycetales bacterium ZRK34]|nr:hypothetical protein HED60_00005 [Planctomycetales bacterium ZRK34]